MAKEKKQTTRTHTQTQVSTTLAAPGVGYEKHISSGRITASGNKRQCAGLPTAAPPDERLR